MDCPSSEGPGGVGRVAQNPVMLTSHPAVAEIELVRFRARLGPAGRPWGLVDVAMGAKRPCFPVGSVSGSALPAPSPLQPSVLILDEFTSGLGSLHAPSSAGRAVVRRVGKDEGAVVVLATHDLAQARQAWADRRLLLAAGRSGGREDSDTGGHDAWRDLRVDLV